MSAIKMGESFWQISNPDDEAARVRYKQAVVESLKIFEASIRLTVKARDRIGLESLRQEVDAMFEKAEVTLRNGNDIKGIGG